MMRKTILHAINMLNLQVDAETNMPCLQKLSDNDFVTLNAEM